MKPITVWEEKCRATGYSDSLLYDRTERNRIRRKIVDGIYENIRLYSQNKYQTSYLSRGNKILQLTGIVFLPLYERSWAIDQSIFFFSFFFLLFCALIHNDRVSVAPPRYLLDIIMRRIVDGIERASFARSGFPKLSR